MSYAEILKTYTERFSHKKIRLRTWQRVPRSQAVSKLAIVGPTTARPA